MDRARSSLTERAALVGIGLILLLFLLLRLEVVKVVWGLVFPLIALLIVLSNVFWWAWVHRHVRKGDEADQPARRRWLPWLWAAYMLVMLSPAFLLLMPGRRLWDAYPVALIMWILAWHLVMVLLGAVSAATSGARGAWRALRSRKIAPATEDDPPRLSRRTLLVRAAVAAPIVFAGGSVVLGKRQEGRFRIRYLDLRLPRLPDRLRGLTMTHISDIHVGRLFRPEHLPRMVEAANKLGSDLLMVTGDFVDHSIDFLPVACDGLAQIEARHGRLMVIGNHDLIDSPQKAVDYLVQHEPHFLIDRTVPFLIGGETIQIAGLFWSRHDEPRGSDPGHAERVQVALASADPRVFTIALAHHPHAFDPLAARGVDLTLSGHTHGGQLMLTPPGSPHPIGGGSLLFRYIWGEYYRGASVLEVNAGIGNWFPFRINAPAEMVQIRLV
jgi:uncharacterized protein